MPLVDELLDLDPAARAARLAAIRHDHPDLLDVVETLLAGCDAAGPLDRTCGDLALPLLGSDDADISRSGERVGSFRLLHEIGRGGMGAVYAAERVDGGFAQHVAIKILRPGLDSEHVLRRFLAERRILARLEHPHIARLIRWTIGGGNRTGARRDRGDVRRDWLKAEAFLHAQLSA